MDSFRPKSCYLRITSSLFMNECINQGRIYRNVAQYQLGARRSNLKIFFGLHLLYIWQKDVAKISKVPGAQRDVNPARQ